MEVLKEAITLDVVAITRVGFQIFVAGLIQFFLSRAYVKYKSWKTNDVFFKELAILKSDIDTLKENLKHLEITLSTKVHSLENQQNLQQGEVNILTQIVLEIIPENKNLKTPDEDGGDRKAD
jgi:hypothetical protein